ncbi:5-formyltetrahydrofolate cyclo-ligase [Marinospirillum insulare]|nr:5-formyltetrahydrofolate cyclo-ligase [Marinospirillum insulare]
MHTTSSSHNNRSSLRRLLRQKRRQLSSYEQKVASYKACQRVSQQAWFLNASNLAVYMASDGELDPLPLALKAQKMGKRVYLPVLHPLNSNHLLFIRFTSKTPLHKNRFGILEPCLKGYGLERINSCKIQALDLLLMPLVGFDPHGGRLGMGGGFYDRTLAVKPNQFKRPKLIGLAHECQKVDQLSLEAWDVPLTGIVTPEEFYLPQ